MTENTPAATAGLREDLADVIGKHLACTWQSETTMECGSPIPGAHPSGFAAAHLADVVAAHLSAGEPRGEPAPVSTGEVAHLYVGQCPDQIDSTARDPHCPACRLLTPATASAPSDVVVRVGGALREALFPVYGQLDSARTARMVEFVLGVVAPFLGEGPGGVRDEVARVLAEHVPDEGLNECSCGGWSHWEDEYEVRVATLTAHQADAVMGVLRRG